jgi:hypothetical protein
MRKAPPGLYVRQYALTLAAASFVSAAAAMALSVGARRAGTSWRAGTILVLVFACIYMEWWFYRRANPVADGYVGEVAVARALAPLEADGYRVLGPRRWDRRSDIDQIVVGPTGVFAIEIKAWKGRMVWRGDKLLVGGKDRTRKLRKASAHAMRVKEKIPPGLGVDWVEAVTVFADSAPSVGCRNKKSYWAVPAEDLPGFIRSRHAGLTEEECAWIASVLT